MAAGPDRPGVSYGRWSSAAGAARLRRPTDILLLVGCDPRPRVCSRWQRRGRQVPTTRCATLLALAAAGVRLALERRLRRHGAVGGRGRRARLRASRGGAASWSTRRPRPRWPSRASVGVGALAGTHPSDIVDGLVSSGPPVVYVASRVAVLTADASSRRRRTSPGHGGTRAASSSAWAPGGWSAWRRDEPARGERRPSPSGSRPRPSPTSSSGRPQGRLTDGAGAGRARRPRRADDRVAASPASTDSGERTCCRGRTEQDTELRVTVYGRDAWDSQVVGSLWTALTRRGERARWRRGTRRSRVEHEALFTLLASKAGVPTLDVVAVGVADQGDALLGRPRSPRALVARRARRADRWTTSCSPRCGVRSSR